MDGFTAEAAGSSSGRSPGFTRLDPTSPASGKRLVMPSPLLMEFRGRRLALSGRDDRFVIDGIVAGMFDDY